MLLSVRSVDAADHIACRVHAAEKYVTVAGTTDRIVNSAAEQETLEHSADSVAAYDALSDDHGGVCRGGAGEVNRTESAVLKRIAVFVAAILDYHDDIVVADAVGEGAQSAGEVNRSEYAWTQYKAVTFAVAGGVASTDLVVTVNPGHIGPGGTGNINRLELGSGQQESMVDSVLTGVASYDIASDVDGGGLRVGSAREIEGKESRWLLCVLGHRCARASSEHK